MPRVRSNVDTRAKPYSGPLPLLLETTPCESLTQDALSSRLSEPPSGSDSGRVSGDSETFVTEPVAA